MFVASVIVAYGWTDRGPAWDGETETLGDLRSIVVDVASRFLHEFDAIFAKLLWQLVLPLKKILLY